jgi:uncharacterized protein YchJ
VPTDYLDAWYQQYTPPILWRTQHICSSSTLQLSLRKDVIATCKKISWDKLVVVETENVSENEAYVTFQTYFKVKGQQGQRSQGFHTQSFVEKSRFLKSSDGVWLYENGEQDWEGNQWV